MSEEEGEYNVTYSGHLSQNGIGEGKLYKWVGYFLDMKFDCVAANEEEAQKKMKEKLIEKVTEDVEPFCIFNTWEVVDE